MHSTIPLSLTSVHTLRNTCPWIDDETISSITAIIRAKENAIVLYSFQKNTARVISVNPKIDLTPQWQRFRTQALSAIATTCPDIFKAATEQEKLTMLVTETSECFFRDIPLTPEKTGALAAFMMYGAKEATGTSDVNLLILEDRGEEVSFYSAVVQSSTT